MPDSPRALGRDLPHVERERHEVLSGQCRVVRQALDASRLRRAGAVEPALAGDHHTLGEVAEHGVGGAAERAPRARAARALSLLPDDLAAEEQAEPVLEDRDHVGRQRAIGLAAEVRDVDRDAAAGLELARALGEHLGEHLEVLEVRAGHALSLELLLVVLAREVRRRRDDQRDRSIVELVHGSRVATDEGVGDLFRRRDVVIRGELGGLEAFIEGSRVVALAAAYPEVRRSRRPSLPHRGDARRPGPATT